MRIAFVSHEYPPDTAGGGIGTYLAQVTPALAAAGHDIEVLCGTRGRPGVSTPQRGLRVHRLAARPGADFRAAVLPLFTALHQQTPIDVVEGTDFDAPANGIKRGYPKVPYVVKLHTPRFVIDELHAQRPRLLQSVRIHLGAWRRGQRNRPGSSIRARPEGREELAALQLADELAAPSRAIAGRAEEWSPGAAHKLSTFPYPFQPSPALQAVPLHTDTHRVTFIGRLEPRKGVWDLATAAREVVATAPEARFLFVGRIMSAIDDDGQSLDALRRRAGRAANRLEFTGAVPAATIPGLLAETDVVVAPSHWESFGLVCCEALAAGRAVIASSAGGMREILDDGRCGILVEPRQPRRLAAAIVRLLRDPELRASLGAAGRARVTSEYAIERVVPLQLASYIRAIERCRRRT